VTSLKLNDSIFVISWIQTHNPAIVLSQALPGLMLFSLKPAFSPQIRDRKNLHAISQNGQSSNVAKTEAILKQN